MNKCGSRFYFNLRQQQEQKEEQAQTTAKTTASVKFNGIPS